MLIILIKGYGDEMIVTNIFIDCLNICVDTKLVVLQVSDDEM